MQRTCYVDFSMRRLSILRGGSIPALTNCQSLSAEYFALAKEAFVFVAGEGREESLTNDDKTMRLKTPNS